MPEYNVYFRYDNPKGEYMMLCLPASCEDDAIAKATRLIKGKIYISTVREALHDD